MTRTDRTARERDWPRCPCCRTRRATREQLLAHQRQHGHQACRCGGYPHPHRPYSPLCDHRPESGVLRALAAGWNPDGGELLDAMIETALTVPGRPMTIWPDDYRRD